MINFKLKFFFVRKFGLSGCFNFFMGFECIELVVCFFRDLLFGLFRLLGIYVVVFLFMVVFKVIV